MSKKLLTIFGATGTQGGSVVNTILAHPQLSSQFSLRGITRNTSSDKAKALASRGVELATADMNDLASLKSALKGSYGVFAVTNYWESQSREIETSQGKAIADACAATGVKHVVWSSLPNVTKLTDGKLKHVSHFDGKSDVEVYFESIKKQSGMAVTHFMPGYYMSNIKSLIKPAPDTGVPTVTLPWDAEKTQIAMFDGASDTGPYVAGIIAAPDPASVDGKHVHAVSEWITPAQMVATLTEVAGTKIAFNGVPESVFESFLPESMAKELTENMVLVRDYSYYGKGTEKDQAENEKIVKDVGLGVTSWKTFVEQNGPWVEK